MRKILLALAGALLSSPALAANPASPTTLTTGTVTPIPVGVRQADRIDIKDGYGGLAGAVCDGVTDDTAAINAAFAAARTSNAYTTGRPITVTGRGALNKACLVTQVNATGFTTFGTGASLNIEDLVLLGTGAGNITLDTSNSLNIVKRNVTIIGSASSPPLIGLQEANLTPTTTACCIHQNYNLQIFGNFTFAARNNAGAETVSDYGSIIRNSGASTGVIWTLGSVTGGTLYTTGTYTGVALTGGTGAGAVATVVVAGGAVTTVTLTAQGKGFTVADTLTTAAANIGGTGSGFSIPVATIAQFAQVYDGANYWNATSSFVATVWTANTYYSQTQDNFYGGSMRYMDAVHSGSPLWSNSTVGLHLHHTYFLNLAATACVDLFDNSATNGFGNDSQIYDIRCEGGVTGSSSFYLYGANASPSLKGFSYRDDYAESRESLISTAANITGATMPDAKLDVVHVQIPNTPLFDNPTDWTLSGQVYVPTGTWTASAAFTGVLNIGGVVSYNGSLSGVIPAWVTSTVYNMGALVTNGGNTYKQSGASGTSSVAPTVSSGCTTGVDSITWCFLSTGPAALTFANGGVQAIATLFVNSDQATPVNVPVIAGSISPNAQVTSPVAGLYLRTGGSAGRSLYVNETGTNTGWDPVVTESALNLNAAGTTIGTATAMTARYNIIGSVPVSGNGVILAGTIFPDEQVVLNRGGNPANVYPQSSSSQIDSLGNGVAVSLAAGGHAAYWCVSTTQCYTVR